jgi:hypothetical protein
MPAVWRGTLAWPTKFAIFLRHDEGIRTSSEASAGEVGDEECKTNTDRSDKGGTMFFSGEHEDGEDQKSSHEHFDEQAADD